MCERKETKIEVSVVKSGVIVSDSLEEVQEYAPKKPYCSCCLLNCCLNFGHVPKQRDINMVDYDEDAWGVPSGALYTIGMKKF